MADWDIEVGETVLRKELHDRWGGGRYGGMEPAVKAKSVFLFTNPSAGEAFGYKYDGWHSDGTLHYTGDGQVGDQEIGLGGNKALLDAEGLGRAVRLFRSESRMTTYLGEFQLSKTPYYRADALDREGEMRSVLVFRLVPVGEVAEIPNNGAVPDISTPQQIPIEASDVEQYAAQRPDEPPMAVRREAKLVGRYVEWLAAHGQDSVRHRVPIPGGGFLYTDIYNTTTDELVEAKASAARTYMRAGLGQLLDYARFVNHKSKALLVPVAPSADLIDLLNSHGCAVIYEQGNTFSRHDPTA